MFKAFVSWRQQGRTIRELSKLSDRELADLGMARREIAIVVRSGLAQDSEASVPVLTWPQIKAARQGFMNAGLLSGA